MSTHIWEVVIYLMLLLFINFLSSEVAPVRWVPLISPLGSTACRCQVGVRDLQGVFHVYLFRCKVILMYIFIGPLLGGSLSWRQSARFSKDSRKESHLDKWVEMGLHHKSLAWLHVFLKECLQKEYFHALNEHK